MFFSATYVVIVTTYLAVAAGWQQRPTLLLRQALSKCAVVSCLTLTPYLSTTLEPTHAADSAPYEVVKGTVKDAKSAVKKPAMEMNKGVNKMKDNVEKSKDAMNKAKGFMGDKAKDVEKKGKETLQDAESIKDKVKKKSSLMMNMVSSTEVADRVEEMKQSIIDAEPDKVKEGKKAATEAAKDAKEKLDKLNPKEEIEKGVNKMKDVDVPGEAKKAASEVEKKGKETLQKGKWF